MGRGIRLSLQSSLAWRARAREGRRREVDESCLIRLFYLSTLFCSPCIIS